MIQAIRHGVFETNSSSSHSFSLASKYEADNDDQSNWDDEISEEEIEEYAEDYEVSIEEAESELRLDRLRESTSYITTPNGKLSFCETLILRLGKYDEEFNAKHYLLLIKEKLYEESAMRKCAFAYDTGGTLVLFEDDDTVDYSRSAFEYHLLDFTKDLLGDYKNMEATCERIKNIVTDEDVVIKVDFTTDFF